MILPKSTQVNRFVPKEKFYAKTSISSKLRQQFTDEIEKITWTNKLAPNTLNISATKYKELQVFEIRLKTSEVSINVLKHIDTFIPYPILFILKKDSAAKAAISFKEPLSKNQNNMKVDTYFQTPWQQNLTLELKGNSVDEIYTNFIQQIEPAIKAQSPNKTKAAVEANKQYQKYQKQIEQYDKQISTEVSISKRQDLARKRHLLKQQMNQRDG